VLELASHAGGGISEWLDLDGEELLAWHETLRELLE